MVDCPTYQNADLDARQEKAKCDLYEYFQVKEGDKTFKWTFSNWEEADRRNRKELPYKALPVEWLDVWAKGWASVGEREHWSRMLKEANPSDICMSTNHMLVVASIRDEATPYEIMEAA